MTKRRGICLAALYCAVAALVSGCTVAAHPLVIDIASSLAPVQSALIQTAREETGAYPTVTVDGTATLVQQILEGSSVDILLSADASSVEKLQQQDLIDGSPVPLARNRLVLAVSANNPAHITGLFDLHRQDVRFAQCAAQLPCGKLAHQVEEANEMKLIPFAETPNVAAAVKLLESDEVDAAFIYASDVLDSQGDLVEVADDHIGTVVATITGVVTSHSHSKADSHKLLVQWASPAFAGTWKKAGYLPLDDK